MIISERQINELILAAHVYLRLLENIDQINPDRLSDCGKHNKKHVANLLMEITKQQSNELRVFE
jgi:hypothetical protein